MKKKKEDQAMPSFNNAKKEKKESGIRVKINSLVAKKEEKRESLEDRLAHSSIR